MGAWFAAGNVAGLPFFLERTISGASEEGKSGGFGDSTLNIVLIVAFAVGISLLAQFLSKRTRRK